MWATHLFGLAATIRKQHNKKAGGSGYQTACLYNLLQIEYLQSVRHPIMDAISQDMHCIVEEEAECLFGVFAQHTAQAPQKGRYEWASRKFMHLPVVMHCSQRLNSAMVYENGTLTSCKPMYDAATPQSAATRQAVKNALFEMVNDIKDGTFTYCCTFGEAGL